MGRNPFVQMLERRLGWQLPDERFKSCGKWKDSPEGVARMRDFCSLNKPGQFHVQSRGLLALTPSSEYQKKVASWYF